MKKSWIVGGAIAVLLGLNLVQGAALIGICTRSNIAAQQTAPIGLTTDPVDNLPPQVQVAVKASLGENTPVLAARLTEVRRVRHDLVRYIASPRYNRREAERRFAVLRVKSDQAQMVAQDMLLDAADNLPPDQRGAVISDVDIGDPGGAS